MRISSNSRVDALAVKTDLIEFGQGYASFGLGSGSGEFVTLSSENPDDFDTIANALSDLSRRMRERMANTELPVTDSLDRAFNEAFGDRKHEAKTEAA